VRDVGADRIVQQPEKLHQDRRCAQAVDIVVTSDCNGLLPAQRLLNPLRCFLHVWKEKGVMKILEPGMEITRSFPGRCNSPVQQERREDGRGAKLPGQAIPPQSLNWGNPPLLFHHAREYNKSLAPCQLIEIEIFRRERQNPAMPEIFEHFHTVGDDEIDALGHANNVVYLKWMQSAAVRHSAAQGWPAEAYRKLGSGWVVRSHQIEYRQPALEGDRIVIRTWVASMEMATSLRRYRIIRLEGDRLLAVAETRWVFINYSNRRPLRIPPEIAGAFQVVRDK